MSADDFLLVVVASAIHSFWNYLVKRSSAPELFVSLSKVAESVIFMLPFLYFFSKNPYQTGDLIWVAGAAVLVSLNYFFLAKAYQHLDLSIAYPISRSSTLFLPFFAAIFIGEQLDIVGYSAIAIVTIGILVIQFRSLKSSELKSHLKLFSSGGTLYALLAAMTVAAYTVWDKIAVSNISPFLYFYSYTFVTSILLLYVSQKRFDFSQAKQLWAKEKRSIVSVALCNTTGYLIILYVLSRTDASLVGTVRQISLVFGFILGYWLLNEETYAPRIFGLLLILCGSVLVAIAG